MSSRVTISQTYFEELVKIHSLYKMGLLVLAAKDDPVAIPKNGVPPAAPKTPAEYLPTIDNQEVANKKPYTPPMGVPRGFIPFGLSAQEMNVEGPSVSEVLKDDGQSDPSQG